ncbi:MAG: 30S ribosome-binding factor RbfA [Gemmatimonadota bacterium]
MSRRLTRLNEQIKREIAEIVRYEVADPRVGPITVTGVEVAPDLMTARVFVLLMASDEDVAGSLEGLAAAAPFIRSQLADRLELRRTPSLRFFVDNSIAQGSRIERLLAEVEPARGWEAEDDVDEGAGSSPAGPGDPDADSPLGA